MSTFLSFLLICGYLVKNENKICDVGYDAFKGHNSEKLPHIVNPIEYRLSYIFDKDLKSYIGGVDIDVTVEHQSDVIVLHSMGNEIKSVDLKILKDTSEFAKLSVPLLEYCLIPKKQILLLRLTQHITKGDKVLIKIKFMGNVSDHLKGIYSVNGFVRKPDNKKIITTLFQPIYARFAFPCFDEPSYKAIFKLELTYPKEYTAISNTNSLSEINLDDKMIRTEFQPTPKMSTYVLGFVLCDFKYVETRTKTGVDIKVWLPEEYLPKTKFVAKYISEALEHFENIFDFPYPLKKLDVVGIFPIGEYKGYEQFGLILTSTITLMIDEDITSNMDRKKALISLTRRIATQWFGCVTTMSWWNDLWLKEGISTFFSVLCVFDLYSHYRICDLYMKEIISSPTIIDSTSATHPIMLPPNFDSTVEELYDPITIYKGADVLSMLYFAIGKVNLMNCINEFLKKHAYSTATSHDLLAIIKHKTGNLNYKMTNILIEKIGIPVVSVERTKKPGTFKIFQGRFLLLEEIEDKGFEKYRHWILPINYTVSSNLGKNVHFILTKRSHKITVSESDTWIQINREFNDYYRTEYKSGILSELTDLLKKDISIFSVSDRASLISDAFAMICLGKQRVEYAFNHFEFLKGENDFFPMTVFFDIMEFIKMIVHDHDISEKFKKYVLSFSLPIVEKFGWDRIKDDFNREMQNLAIAKSISFDDQKTIDKASEIFKNYLIRKSKTDEYLLPHLGCAYVKKFGPKAFDELMDMFIKSRNERDDKIYLESLLCSQDSKRLKKLLQYSLSNSSKLKIPNIIVSVSQKPIGSKVALDFLVKHREEVFKMIREDPFFYFDQIPKFMSSYKTVKDFKQIESLFKGYDISVVKSMVGLGLEFILQNIFWIENNLEDLTKYMAKI